MDCQGISDMRPQHGEHAVARSQPLDFTLLSAGPHPLGPAHRGRVSAAVRARGKAPRTEPYERLLAGGFADWRLQIDGKLARQLG